MSRFELEILIEAKNRLSILAYDLTNGDWKCHDDGKLFWNLNDMICKEQLKQRKRKIK